MGALIYLTLCSTKNRVRARLRRLREPRYAAGLLMGLAYFYFLLGPRAGGRKAGGFIGLLAGVREPLELVGALLVFVIVALTWLWPSRDAAALSFSRADVQFLFPAPFTRRQLITYKLARMQVGAFTSSAIMTLLFRPRSMAAGWTFFLGMSIGVSILIVHLTAVSLSRASLRQHGRAGLARQWLPVLLVVGTAVVLAGTVYGAWPRLSSLERSRDVWAELQRISSTGLAAIVLWPLRAIVRLPLSASGAEFLRALPVGLMLYALSFWWALRSDAAFEEASAELAEKVARIRSGTQPALGAIGKRRPPFHLATTGQVEIALLWKNLIMLGRYATLKRAAAFLPAIVVLGVLMALSTRKEGSANVFAFFCFLFALITVMMGPLMIRNDLRRDLASLALLKSWPIRGAALLRGEVLAPAAVLSVVAWGFILGASMSQAHVLSEIGLASLGSHLSYTAAALAVVPGLVVTQLMTQNAVAVVFPAWTHVGPNRTQGIDVMGQRLLMMGGMLLTLILAVLPAAAFALIAAAVIYYATSVVPVVVPALVLTASLVAECLLVAEALGRVIDRTDPSAIEAIE